MEPNHLKSEELDYEDGSWYRRYCGAKEKHFPGFSAQENVSSSFTDQGTYPYTPNEANWEKNYISDF